MVQVVQMKNARITLMLLIMALSVLIPVAVFASDISGALYFAGITVTNNSTATTNVATVATINTTNLINGGYLNAGANNSAIRNTSGADVPFMPGYTPSGLPWVMFVPSIGNNSILSYILYTAESSGGEISYFADLPGMTVADNATLEPSANFSISQTGRVNTFFSDNYTDRNMVLKEGAYRTYVPENERIISSIGFGFRDTSYIANDYAVKAAGVVMPAGATLSIDAWVNLDALDATFGHFLAVGDLNVANSFVVLRKDNLNRVNFIIGNVGATGEACTWVSTNAMTANEWHLITATYDSNATPEAHVYMDGVEIPGADTGDGTDIFVPNTFMATGASRVGGGYLHFFDGDLDEVRISDNTRTLVEHQTAYNGGVGLEFAVDGNTVSLWHFTEGAGALVNDATSTNDLTMVGSTRETTSPVHESAVYADGVVPGEHVVTTAANVTHMTLHVDAVLEDTVALNGRSISDNASDWIMAQNNVLPYLSTANFTVSSVLRGSWAWGYGLFFYDLSGSGNTAVPTFISASSDPDVSANMSNFQPVSEAIAPDFVLGAAPAFIDPEALTGNVTGTFTTTPALPAGSFPLAGVITAVASATGTPPQLPLLIIAVVIIIVIGLSFSYAARKLGGGTILFKILLIAGVMGIFVGVGNFGFEWWMVVLFLMVAPTFAVASKQGGW
jgi:hypothetical protein